MQTKLANDYDDRGARAVYSVLLEMGQVILRGIIQATSSSRGAISLAIFAAIFFSATLKS